MVHGTHNALTDSRNDSVVTYVNGELLPRESAKISVFDSGFLLGDGVWEGLRLHHGVLVFVEDHLNRLYQGAKTIGLDIGMSPSELQAAIWETLNANQMSDHVHVRVMITRGIKKTPSQDPRFVVGGASIVIIAEYKQADPATLKQGVRLFTSTVRRGSPDYLDPRLNCHSKLHEVQALIQALEAGADEALMLDTRGFVSTCNATNFFMVKDQEVWTSTGQYCMNGITRSKVIQVCRDNNIRCFEKDFSLFDLAGATEAFVTGTFGGLTPVSEIDGKPLPKMPGPMTRKLSDMYSDLISDAVNAD